MSEFVEYTELPLVPGSLTPTPELLEALAHGIVTVEGNSDRHGATSLESIGRSIGMQLLSTFMVEPLTPVRVVEVVYPLVEREGISPARKIELMTSVFKGAMEAEYFKGSIE